MKKLLSIVLALALVFGMLPVYAASAFDKEGLSPAENLKAYGFLKGGNDGELMLDSTLSRQQLAIILVRLMGAEADAEALAEAGSDYADAAEFPAWAAGSIAYCKSKALMNGKADNKFDNLGTVSGQQVAIVLLRALGYEEEAAWAADKDFIAILKEKTEEKVVVTDSEAIIRKDIFNAMWPAVSEPVMKDGKILGEEVGKFEKPVVSALEIASVKADNLKQVVVEFNQKVDKDNLGKFSLEGKNVVKTEDPMLLEDGVTVVLTVKKQLQDSDVYTLTVEGTVAAANEMTKLEKVEKEFKALDVDRPEVESMVFSGPKNVTITFSEPIKTVEPKNIKVKKDKSTYSVKKVEAKGNNVYVTLYSSFADGKEYTLDVKGVKDYNDMENLPVSKTLAYAKDTTAPVVEDIVAKQEYVVVTFSKPVIGLKSKYFHHSFSKSAYSAVELLSNDEKVSSTDLVKEVKVVFYNGDDKQKPLPGGSVKFMIDGDEFADLWGNKFAEYETRVDVVEDTVKPEVASAELKEGHEDVIVVKFTKAVEVAKKSFKVEDEDDKNVFVKKTEVKANEYEITIKDLKKGTKVTLTVDDVKDTSVNANKLEKFTQVIEIEDKTAPVVEKVAFKPGKYDGDDTIASAKVFVFFSEAVGSSATDKANYMLRDTKGIFRTLSNSGEFFEDNNDIVVFTLTKKENDKITADRKEAGLLVKNVKDTAGNTVSAEVEPFACYDKSQAVAVDKIVAVNDKTIEVKFNQKVTGYDEKKISVEDNKITSIDLQKEGKLVVIEVKDSLIKNNGDFKNPTITFDEKSIEGQFKTLGSVIAVEAADKIAAEIPENEFTFVKSENAIVVKTTRPVVAAGQDKYAQVANIAKAFDIELDGDALTFANGGILNFKASANKGEFRIIVNPKDVKEGDLSIVYNKTGLLTAVNEEEVVGKLNSSDEVKFSGAPVDPSEPTDPTDPTDPTEPVDPAELSATYIAKQNVLTKTFVVGVTLSDVDKEIEKFVIDDVEYSAGGKVGDMVTARIDGGLQEEPKTVVVYVDGKAITATKAK